MRYIYFASGEIAVPLLKAMIRGGEPPCVVVTADALSPKPKHDEIIADETIADVAHGAGIAVVASRDEDSIGHWCQKEGIKVAILFSFGRKIPSHWLTGPEYGFINIHPSALPRWRGASPIAHTIWFGDRSLSLSMVQMDHCWDHGPILAQHTLSVSPNATATSLTKIVADTASHVFPIWWRQWQKQELVAQPQSDQGITQAPRLKKTHGKLCFHTMSAEKIERTVRAMNPWPSAWFVFRGETVKVIQASLPTMADMAEMADNDLSSLLPGRVINRKLWVATANGIIALDKIQRPGRNVVDGVAAMNGWRMKPMAMLGDPSHTSSP